MGLGLLVVSGAALLVQASLSQLRPGRTLEGRIGGEEVHTYSIPASRDDFVEVSVEQRGIDLTVSLLDYVGKNLVLFDGASAGDSGVEVLPALIDKSGTYQVEIKATDPHDQPGEYRVHLDVRQPSQRDLARAMAVREATRRQDPSALAKAVGHAKNAHDRQLLADLVQRLGLAHYGARRYEQARTTFEQAEREYRAGGNLLGQAHAWFMQARALKKLNDLQGALDAGRIAEGLYERLGGRQGDLGRARVYGDMAAIQDQLGNYGLARIRYEEALAVWPPGLKEPDRIQVLFDLGVVYLSLAQPDQAQGKFEEVLLLSDYLSSEELACKKTWAWSLMGQAYSQKGDESKALDYFLKAFGMSARCKDRMILAATANQSASLYLDRPPKLLNRYVARLFFQQAFDLAEDSFNRANSQGGLAALKIREGDPEEAAQMFAQLLKVRQEQKYLLGIVGALLGRAEAEVALGNLEVAQETLRESLEQIETLRLGPKSDTLSATILASRRQNFELSVATYMMQHQRDSRAGFDIKAFEVNETARARVLMDWLSGDWGTAGAHSRASTAEKALSDRLQELKRLLSQREDLAEEEPSQEMARQKEAWEREVRELVLKLQDLRAESRTVDLKSSEPWTLQEIQERVLDDRTLLLSYWFGTKGKPSYLWAVDSGSITTYSFSSQHVRRIEELAKKVQRHLSIFDRETEPREILRDLDELSRLVLPTEIASRLDDHRLLVVADGELQSIPFQVLQDPRVPLVASAKGWTGHMPLVERHAVITLPSASMLGLLRKELAGRRVPPKKLAVFADPVFNALDGRVSGFDERGEERSAALDTVLEGLKRLDYTGTEAAAILKMVRPEESFSAIGFDANIETVLNTKLSEYEIIHIATHGFSEPLPDMAGLAFSGVHPDLTLRRGFLHAYEISYLDLPVELVVLSACETGVGESVPGEGMFNLSRAFFYAGSRRVAVTLWKVHDEATAELMEHFYQGHLLDRLEPSEALQQAQKAMRRTPQWQHPYFWGGFVLQGEW